MRSSEYRDLIANYVHTNFAALGLAVYTEVPLGRTIIGKARRIDVFVIHEGGHRAIAIECKYQDVVGTTDEKIPYALQDLAALRVPGCLVYAGEGWSTGVLHTLASSNLAAYCLPTSQPPGRSDDTIELDHILAATFGLWGAVIPASRRYPGTLARSAKRTSGQLPGI